MTESNRCKCGCGTEIRPESTWARGHNRTDRTCSICSGDHYGHGWCQKHWLRWRKYGDPEAMHPKKEALRANRSPDRDDLVWAAGFLEGEGHFGNNGSRSKSEVVQVAQTNLEPLERARDVFGGSITKYEPDEENRSTYWTWRTSGYRARGIMMTLYPLLSRAKQEQIRSALTYWTGQ